LQLTAKVLVERGSLYHSLAKDPAAAEDLRAGVAALDELAGLRADSTSIRVDRAIARINLTAVLLDLGDVDGAADAIHRARADAEWLVASFPDAEPFRRRLAGALINEGLVLRKRGDDAGCREAWERAVELGAELVASPRPSGESLLQAGMALGNLCSIDRDEDRLDECLEHADRADEILSRALELSPKDMLVARSLQYARITRERAWLALDELEEARAACEAAAQVAPVDPQAQRAMADGWLELASHAPDESESLETRALAALQRAVELGWNDAVDLEENPLLAPLRARPGFPAVGTH